MDHIKKRDNPFTDYNHMEIARAEQDYAEVYLDVTREATNVYHVVHGGALFTMADYCAGVTACSNGLRYVTQDASVQFIRNTGTGRITARSKVISRGRRICVVEVKITSEDGSLLFNSIFSMYCLDA